MIEIKNRVIKVKNVFDGLTVGATQLRKESVMLKIGEYRNFSNGV